MNTPTKEKEASLEFEKRLIKDAINALEVLQSHEFENSILEDDLKWGLIQQMVFNFKDTIKLA